MNDALDLYVFEDLNIRNMTKRPKAKRDANGQFLPNGRKAKAGLNQAILSSAWGEVVSFTRYNPHLAPFIAKRSHGAGFGA